MQSTLWRTLQRLRNRMHLKGCAFHRLKQEFWPLKWLTHRMEFQLNWVDLRVGFLWSVKLGGIVLLTSNFPPELCRSLGFAHQITVVCTQVSIWQLALVFITDLSLSPTFLANFPQVQLSLRGGWFWNWCVKLGGPIKSPRSTLARLT